MSALLLYWGFMHLLTEEHRQLFFSIPLRTIIPSVILAIPGFLIGGIEMRFLYSRLSKIKLSTYDTATLPFVINLWGFIFPFQGSFIYTVTYVFAKYKQTISDSIKVYLVSFSMSMSIAGLIGLIYSLCSNKSFPGLFPVVCSLLFINPILLHIVGRLSKIFKDDGSQLYKLIIKRLGAFIFPDKLDKELISYLLLIKLAAIILNGAWMYWVTITLKINLSAVQLILILLLMNITALAKLTPGNIGINQLASGGIAVLVGGTMSDGFMLSTFQYITNIIIAIIFGGVFSFVNFKFLNWRALSSAVAELKKKKK